MSKESNTTEPGIGPRTLDATTVPEAPALPRDTTPGAAFGNDVTTIDVDGSSSTDAGPVARYRTDPGLPESPETALLRNVRIEKKRGVVGFRDGLADVRAGSRAKAERDAALERLVVGEPAIGVRSPEVTVPMRGRPSEPAAIRRLVLVGLAVVLAGVVVLVLLRAYLSGSGDARPSQAASSTAAPTDPPTAAPSVSAVPFAPSASVSAPPRVPPSAAAASAAPSTPSAPSRPHPGRSAEPRDPHPTPKPTSTASDLTEGT
jgi:hypothetical protein